MVKDVCICDAVYGSVDSEEEKRGVGDVAQAASNSWYHLSTREGLHEKNERHDRQDIMVGGEWREPVDGEIMNPDDENREIYREDPKH